MRTAFVAPEILEKRAAGEVTYRCRCCGDAYVRGSFRCCAPPTGMRSEKWLALACRKVDAGGCGKCFRHCTCADKAARVGPGPLASLGMDVLAKLSGLQVTK